MIEAFKIVRVREDGNYVSAFMTGPPMSLGKSFHSYSGFYSWKTLEGAKKVLDWLRDEPLTWKLNGIPYPPSDLRLLKIQIEEIMQEYTELSCHPDFGRGIEAFISKYMILLEEIPIGEKDEIKVLQ